MPDYDFHQLSPYDMEVLARDLLQVHWGVTIESFKSGKDDGIDLRYASGTKKTIVQVKHLAKTGLAGLLRQVESEAIKVARLQPKRYVLVTSVPLSPANKDKIVGIVGSDVLCAPDVIGRDEINNLLGQHSEIESKHLSCGSRVELFLIGFSTTRRSPEASSRRIKSTRRRVDTFRAVPILKHSRC
jgi:hypothetical protein